jgi:pSer/pThr/pTyr-binding forkhead associated (FHA) protein
LIGASERIRTTSIVAFPTLFNLGFYGGLACCIFSIAANALYTALRRRGNRRHLTTAIIVCVVSAVLLLPAIIWFDLRFSVKHALLSMFEIDGLLVYVVLCGWVLPLSMTILYCFTASAWSPIDSRQKQEERTKGALNPPRYQPGVQAPFVFGEDAVWAWLEYGNGNFQGQRLDLKRAIATIGRDEDCDIWLDDEMASRHHAEIAWDQGRACLTDCGSLNGMSLNGRRVHGTVLMHSGDIIEIGAMRFLFLLAEQRETSGAVDDDPLSKHTWRSSFDLQADSLSGVEAVLPVDGGEALKTNTTLPVTRPDEVPPGELQPGLLVEKSSIEPTSQTLPVPSESRATLRVQDGEFAGWHFVIDRPTLTLGRGSECSIVINDPSISRMHIQFLHQTDGDYIQDLGSSNGTLINGEPLRTAQLLKRGDVVGLGNIHLLYTVLQPTISTPPLLSTLSSPSLRSLSGPTPLKLPSRMKQS